MLLYGRFELESDLGKPNSLAFNNTTKIVSFASQNKIVVPVFLLP
jgi:hypothetical protein